MRIVIVGGGKLGSTLARALLEDGHAVCLVEHRPNVLARLHRELPTEVIFDGDGTRAEVVKHAGIGQCEVLVLVTGDDETNLIAAMVGKRLFTVPWIIARINNPKNAWLFTPEIGVDVALNQADLLVSLITEHTETLPGA